MQGVQGVAVLAEHLVSCELFMVEGIDEMGGSVSRFGLVVAGISRDQLNLLGFLGCFLGFGLCLSLCHFLCLGIRTPL